MTALRKVLVVDDDPVVGASFHRVLSGKGYLVVSAENGAEALQRVKDEKFDAVFTDLRMPGMDGLEVAERVRAAQPWTPVVIITGYGSPASEARARSAGVSLFLHKPLSPETIEDSADQAVRTVPEGVAAPEAAAPVAAAPPAEAPAAAAAAEPEAHRTIGGTLKNMALFLSAPFIGLAYAVLLPFIGMGMLAWVAAQAVIENRKARAAHAAEAAREAPAEAPPAAVPPAEEAVARQGPLAAAKVVLQLAVAPFVGLAYIIALPFVGLAAIAWIGIKAALPQAREH